MTHTHSAGSLQSSAGASEGEHEAALASAHHAHYQETGGLGRLRPPEPASRPPLPSRSRPCRSVTMAERSSIYPVAGCEGSDAADRRRLRRRRSSPPGSASGAPATRRHDVGQPAPGLPGFFGLTAEEAGRPTPMVPGRHLDRRTRHHPRSATSTERRRRLDAPRREAPRLPPASMRWRAGCGERVSPSAEAAGLGWVIGIVSVDDRRDRVEHAHHRHDRATRSRSASTAGESLSLTATLGERSEAE
jgi:hypothetical protein